MLNQNTELEPTVPPPPGRGCGLIFMAIMLVMGAMGGAALGVFVWVLDDAESTIQALEDFRPRIGSKIISSDDELLGEFTIEGRQLVPLNEMPLHLQKAFVATEDDKFYEHKGVRIDAIVNAAMDNLLKNRSRGGSTITQQVVRNVENLGVTQERSIKRKIREAIVAYQVERDFTKDEILELYLNQIFLGVSANGVESAAQQYFAKSCRDLSLGESAMLAGLTRWPNTNNPFRSFDNAYDRMEIVLAQMLENNFITQEQRDAAMAEDMQASVVTPEERKTMVEKGEEGGWNIRQFKGPYFVEEIRRSLLDKFETDTVFADGLEIETTLDWRLQQAAEKALLTALDEFDKKKLASLTKAGQEAEFTPVSGGLICIDNQAPNQGMVRAMVGGRNFALEKYNTATQARRQPGSSIKPFVWAVAIANGYTPSTIIVDEPFSRKDGAGNTWSPKNFDASFSGPVTLRHSLEKSVNIVSVKLVDIFGMNQVRTYLQACGIRTPIDDMVGLTIGLGTPEVTLLDHCVAYSCFANGGRRYDPIMVKEIRDRDGIIRYNYKEDATNSQALDPKLAYVMTHLMEGVCTPGPGYYPTGHRTSVVKHPHGGKTGTTNMSRNTWFCGFSRQYTCIVWIGYRDNRSLGRGADYTGGRLAAPIWTEFMLAAHEGLPELEFEVPPGVEFFNVDRISGVEGGTFKEAFIEGTYPPKRWSAPESETEGESVEIPNSELPPSMQEPLDDGSEVRDLEDSLLVEF